MPVQVDQAEKMRIMRQAGDGQAFITAKCLVVNERTGLRGILVQNRIQRVQRHGFLDEVEAGFDEEISDLRAHAIQFAIRANAVARRIYLLVFTDRDQQRVGVGPKIGERGQKLLGNLFHLLVAATEVNVEQRRWSVVGGRQDDILETGWGDSAELFLFGQ